MDIKSSYRSSADCRSSHSRPIESNKDNVLIIRDLPASAQVKPLLWIMAGSVPVIALVSIITSQSYFAVLALIFVLLGSIAFVSRETITEIDLADGTIRKTWKAGGYAKRQVHSLDDVMAVEIKDESRMIEGYSRPFFLVQLSGRIKEIAVYSTDDPEEATALQAEVAAFLKQFVLSTQRLQ